MTIRALLAIFFSCTVLLFIQPAKAERRWAYEYLDACEPGSSEWPVCEGYVEGYLGAIKYLVDNHKISNPYCLPEGISTKQVAEAFKDFIVTGPFSILAMEGALNLALIVKFPCRIS